MIDPRTLPEFNVFWDFTDPATITSDAAGKALSIAPSTSALAPSSWLSDYNCAAPDPEAPNPNCTMGAGFPAQVVADGIRGQRDAGYMLRELSRMHSGVFRDLQAGFTFQQVVTVHSAAYPLQENPMAIGNHKCEILFSDNRGSAGSGVGLWNGSPHAICWMNTGDLDPRGVRLPISLSAPVLLTWHYPGPGGTLTFEVGAATGTAANVIGYRVHDARLTLLGVVYAGGLYSDPPVRASDATMHKLLVMSPAVPKATYDETGAWLLGSQPLPPPPPPQPTCEEKLVSIEPDLLAIEDAVARIRAALAQ